MRYCLCLVVRQNRVKHNPQIWIVFNVVRTVDVYWGCNQLWTLSKEKKKESCLPSGLGHAHFQSDQSRYWKHRVHFCISCDKRKKDYVFYFSTAPLLYLTKPDNENWVWFVITLLNLLGALLSRPFHERNPCAICSLISEHRMCKWRFPSTHATSKQPSQTITHIAKYQPRKEWNVFSPLLSRNY